MPPPPALMSAADAIARAHELYRVGAFREARALCEPQLQHGKATTVDLALLLGAITSQCGAWHECAEFSKQAIALNSSCAEAYNNLATALRELNQSNAAVPLYRQAVAIRPQFVEAVCGLAMACNNIGHHAEAIAALRDALSLQPTLLNAHFVLGCILSSTADWEGARQALAQAIRLRTRALDPRVPPAVPRQGHTLAYAALLHACSWQDRATCRRGSRWATP